MKSLWLPELKDTISNLCSRKIIGFVTKGDNSMINGHGRAIGFITLGAMKTLLQRAQKDKVLVRNNNTRKYRFAKISIINP